VSQQTARYQRSTGGLVGAMVVLVAVVLLYAGLQALKSDPPSSAVRAVDYAGDVPAARKAADFALVAPPRLPGGWRATTVSFSGSPGAHWHLGVLTDQGRYVGLEQGDEPVRALVDKYVDDAATRGRPVDVAGRPWATYTDADGDLALVRRVGRTTTLVVGHDVPRSDLVSYTAGLR
jgi:Protein of unknown function (DUF4245)